MSTDSVSIISDDDQQLDLLSFISDKVVAVAQVKGRRRKAYQVSAPRMAGTNKKLKGLLHLDGLDKKKKLENFIQGESNDQAVLIAKSAIEKPGRNYPFVYYVSPSGLGKSHLLNASVNEWLEKDPYASICLIEGREFAFKIKQDISYFEKFDGIFIDDFDSLLTTTDAHSDFCRFYDLIKRKSIQLVVASTVLPKCIRSCDDRFIARLNSACVQKIFSIDRKLAFLILEDRIQGCEHIFSDEVKELIVDSFHYHVYGIESACLKLKSYYQTYGKAITFEIAFKELQSLGQLVDSEDNSKRVLQKVSAFYNIGVEKLCGRSRKKEFSTPRHVAMYLLKKKCGISLSQIGKVFERDHSSVVYAVSKIQEKVESDDNFAKQLHKLS